MIRILALLALLAVAPALAGTPVTLVDPNGNFVGTASNPSVTQGSLSWIDYTGASIAANACIVSPTHQSGASTGIAAPYAYYQVKFVSTVAGNLYTYDATTPATLVQVAATPVSAGTPVVLKAPAFGTQFLAQFCAGAAGGTYSMADGFTAN